MIDIFEHSKLLVDMNVKNYRFSLSWKRFAASWQNLDYEELNMNETSYDTGWDRKYVHVD